MIGLLTQSGLTRLADQMSAVVYGWGILQTTGSALSAGLVTSASLAALVLGTLFSGRIIARFGSRPVALAGAWTSATMAIIISLLFWLGEPSPLMIAGLAALAAVLDGPMAISTETNYPQVARLARVDLVRLNGADDGLDHVAGLIAPATGAALVALGGIELGVTALAALSLMGAIVLTISMPAFRVPGGAQTVDLRDAFRNIRSDKLLLPLVVLFSLVVALLFAFQLVILPLLIQETGGNSGLLALFLASSAMGGIAGAMSAEWFAAKMQLRAVIALSFAFLAAGVALFMGGVDEMRLLVSGITMGLPAGILSPIAAALFQTRPPKALRADVQAVATTAILGVAPAAMLTAGLVADNVPHDVLLLIKTAALAALAIIALLWLPRHPAASPSSPS
jgi:macrolide resistance protein